MVSWARVWKSQSCEKNMIFYLQGHTECLYQNINFKLTVSSELLILLHPHYLILSKVVSQKVLFQKNHMAVFKVTGKVQNVIVCQACILCTTDCLATKLDV